MSNRPNIHSLPNETIDIILRDLPIDENLAKVGGASQSLASFLFQSFRFAQRHLCHQIKAANAASPCEYLIQNRLYGSKWKQLPLVYQTAIYGEVVGAKRNATSAAILVPSKWIQSPEFAFKIMSTLVSTLPGFAWKDRALHFAATSNHIAVVKLLLEDPRTYKCVSKDCSALSAAASRGDSEIVRLLLTDRRVDPNELHGKPLRNAVRKKHIDIVEMLLGDDRVDPNSDQLQTFCKALESSEIVQLYLANPRFHYGDMVEEVLDWVYRSPREVVIMILHDFRVGSRLYVEQLALACKHGLLDDAQRLMAYANADSALLDWAIYEAAKHGHADVVDYLLQHPNANPSCQENAALVIATRGESPSVVKVLLSDSRVNPSDRNNAVLQIAMTREHWEIIGLLLRDPRLVFEESNANLKSEICMLAAKNGREEILELLNDK